MQVCNSGTPQWHRLCKRLRSWPPRISSRSISRTSSCRGGRITKNYTQIQKESQITPTTLNQNLSTSNIIVIRKILPYWGHEWLLPKLGRSRTTISAQCEAQQSDTQTKSPQCHSQPLSGKRSASQFGLQAMVAPKPPPKDSRSPTLSNWGSETWWRSDRALCSKTLAPRSSQSDLWISLKTSRDEMKRFSFLR